MTLYRFAIGMLLLSLNQAVFQAFAEAAGPLGEYPRRKFSEVRVKSDSLAVTVNSREDSHALGDGGFAEGETYGVIAME
jgi:hypothetical protein